MNWPAEEELQSQRRKFISNHPGIIAKNYSENAYPMCKDLHCDDCCFGGEIDCAPIINFSKIREIAEKEFLELIL